MKNFHTLSYTRQRLVLFKEHRSRLTPSPLSDTLTRSLQPSTSPTLLAHTTLLLECNQGMGGATWPLTLSDVPSEVKTDSWR